jgi:pentapeptide repeat protein
MSWLLFVGMVVIGLVIVFLIVSEIAKKLESGQERKVKDEIHSRSTKPREQAPGKSSRANNEHLQRLMNAVAAQGGAWNEWRKEHPHLLLAFRGVDLSDADLHFANLSDVDFSGANLSHADLSHANLSNANLGDANLTGANLTGADLTGADFEGADITDALLDVKGIKGAKGRSAAGVSRMEKFALGLFKSGKARRERPQEHKGGPPRAGKST